jgi:uncharacterized protein
MAHALIEAARRGQAAKIRELVATAEGRALAMKPLRGTDETALIAAARAGHLDCVEALLPVSDVGAYSGERLSIDRHCALELAAKGGHAACVRALVGPTLVDANRGKFRAFDAAKEAIRGGHAECLGALLAHPAVAADTSSNHELLLFSARHGKLAGVKMLLPLCDAQTVAHGNRFERESRTALWLAARDGHLECLRALAPHSDANVVDFSGSTALDAAVGMRHPECVRELLPHCAPATREAALKKALDGFDVWAASASSPLPACVDWLASREDADPDTRAKAMRMFGPEHLPNAFALAERLVLRAALGLGEPLAQPQPQAPQATATTPTMTPANLTTTNHAPQASRPSTPLAPPSAATGPRKDAPSIHGAVPASAGVSTGASAAPIALSPAPPAPPLASPAPKRAARRI